MLIYMSSLALFGLYALGNPTKVLTVLLVALPFGVSLDYILHKLGGSKPKFGALPQSGLITSLIVSVLMPLDINPFITVLAVSLAIGSKHYLRFGGEHIFNPAAFGVTFTALLFKHPLGWWPDAYIWLVILLGILNVWRVKKYWQVLGFAVIYSGLLVMLFGAKLTGIESLPWFFILFMLPEPVTSLQGRNKSLAFGAITALFVIFFTSIRALGPVALTLGLLSANMTRFIKR